MAWEIWKNQTYKAVGSNPARSTFIMKKIKFSIDGKSEEVLITNKPNLEFLTGGLLNKGIHASKGLIQNFSKKEIKILFYHELFHKYHTNKIIGLFVLFTILLFIFAPKLFHQEIILLSAVVIFWLMYVVEEISADVYASKKVGWKTYLHVLKKYSKLKAKEGLFKDVIRQLTHLPHPIRHFLIEKFG